MGLPGKTAYADTSGANGGIKQLVTQWLPLVSRVVNSMAVNLDPSVSREDMIGAGTLGLVQAAHRFDESRGTKFSTYAYWRIRGAVVDFLRKSDALSRDALAGVRRLRDAAREFRADTGRVATVEDLAESAGMSEQEVLKFLSYESWQAPLSSLSGPDEGPAEPNILAALVPDDAPSPAQQLERKEQVERLAEAIEGLPEREKQIVVMYYYEDLYMSEIAQVLGISEPRVSQLHTRALYNLTRKLEEL